MSTEHVAPAVNPYDYAELLKRVEVLEKENVSLLTRAVSAEKEVLRLLKMLRKI